MATTQNQAKKTTTPHHSGRHLPSDLFPEILSRLPVKSLLRFRCVTKSWLGLVDDDADFARLHLNAFKNNSDHTRLFVEQSKHGCVVRCSDTFEPISNIPFTFSTDYLYAVSSLHGLILQAYFTEKLDQFWDLKVWNPSIRKLQEVPPLFKPEVSSDSILLGRELGLGYDPVANSHKIVRIICYESTLRLVAIYVLGDDSWKIIRVQDKGSPLSNWHWNVYAFGKAVYFRSSMYFIAMDAQKDGVWVLVGFDLSTEVFSSVRMPDKDPQGFSRWTLVSVDGGSSLVAFDRSSSDLYTWIVDRVHVLDQTLRVCFEGFTSLAHQEEWRYADVLEIW